MARPGEIGERQEGDKASMIPSSKHVIKSRKLSNIVDREIVEDVDLRIEPEIAVIESAVWLIFKNCRQGFKSIHVNEHT